MKTIEQHHFTFVTLRNQCDVSMVNAGDIMPGPRGE